MLNLRYSTLPSIGINPLTGEACAYSQRILCDLNESGCMLVAEWLGLRYDSSKLLSDSCPFADNWNSTVGDTPAVASIMLDNSVFPALMRFALMRKGYQYVFGIHTDLTAFNDSDLKQYPLLQRYLDGDMDHEQQRLYRNPKPFSTAPMEGSRNVHAMTGRAI